MTDTFQIAVIPGDGIGTEVTEATLAVLDAVQRRINGYHLSLMRLCTASSTASVAFVTSVPIPSPGMTAI